MHPQVAYDELLARAREAALLDSCAALLGWDEETYLPPAGVAHRADQLALLAGLHHARVTDPRVGELLAAVEGTDLAADAEAPAGANVRLLRRRYDRATRVPRELVEGLARTTAVAYQEWAEARRRADFGRFRPWLERVLALKREEAGCLGGPSPYDALLDDYEPGARGADLARLFDGLRAELVPLAAVAAGVARRGPADVLRRRFPLGAQRAFGAAVAAAVGFDFRRGRLDTTLHPFFSTIGPGDCRLATRFEPSDFATGFFGALHEVGHGLYEQGLPAELHGTPVGEVPSLGMHESQARLWENPVGRGRPFWVYFFPRARRAFPSALGDVTPDAFVRAVNHVTPSAIRARADEVTYDLHILIRFELERALLAGDLPAADLPAAWNAAYRRYLGVTPADDAEGCLQDSHWAAGQVGYFPTYTLGNVYGAQLFARAGADLGGFDGAFARGDFGGLLGWLRERVYRHGHRYAAGRLVERATGATPDHRALVAYLRAKVDDLYGIKSE